MRILVFEYITGGGFNNQELPTSLASEGLLMLQALLDDLRELMICRREQPISVWVMMDERLKDRINPQGFEQCIITQAQNTDDEFVRLMLQCDAVWPIAPESEGILQDLCATVEATGRRLLTSPARAVQIAGNKLNTYQLLMQHGIATVPTQRYSDFEWDGCLQWIVKPIDGARTHSTLAALSTYVPTLSFVYSIKARGINRDIFGHEKFCIFKKDCVDSSVAERVVFLLKDRESVCGQLKARIPEFQRMALSAGKKLVEVCG